MSAGCAIEPLRALAGGMETRERLREGGTIAEARDRLAGRIGLAPGTLYNLARNRLKKLDGAVRQRLVAYATHELKQEIGRLEHELEMAAELGARADPGMVAEAEALLERAQQLVREAGGRV